MVFTNFIRGQPNSIVPIRHISSSPSHCPIRHGPRPGGGDHEDTSKKDGKKPSTLCWGVIYVVVSKFGCKICDYLCP
jgi:hypothetical protein